MLEARDYISFFILVFIGTIFIFGTIGYLLIKLWDYNH